MSKHPSRSRGLAFVAAGAVVLLWGASYPAIGIALGHVDPVPLGAVRYAVAGVVFAVLLAAVRPRMPRGADLVRALLSGALGIAVYNALLNSGQASISAGAAGFIASAQPVVVAALAALTLKERPGPLAWLGTAVAFVGVASIAAGQPGGLRFGQGASLVALAAVSSALSFVLQRPLVARYGALTSASTTILSGGLLLSPWLATGLAQVAAAPVSAASAVLFLGVGSGVIGYLAWMRALDHFGASRAANLLYLIAPWAAILDAWVGGARLTASTWVGGALTLAGVALVHRRRASQASPAPAADDDVGRREVLIGTAVVGIHGALAGCARVVPAGPGESKRDDPRAVLDGIAERILSDYPELATSVGMDAGPRARLRAALNDRSLQGVADQRARDAATLERLRRIGGLAIPPALDAACAAALFSHELAAEGRRFDFGDHTIHAAVTQTASPYVVSQMTGSFFHVPEFLNSEHPIATRPDAEAYLERLAAFAVALDAESERIRRDRDRGVAPPGFVLDVVIGQMNRYLAAPIPKSALVTSLARRRRQARIASDMETRAARLLEAEVLPALARQRDELARSRSGAAPGAGVTRLPDAEGYYAWHLRVATTTAMSADEVHALGLELSRSIESTMDALLKSQGMNRGSVGDRVAALGRDPRFLFPDDAAGRAAALAHVEELIAGARGRMAELSRLVLRADVVVRRVPVEIEAGAAGGYVALGSLEGSRPAQYWLNLRDTAVWPRWALATLSYHEALPGHVWQESYGIETKPWHPVRALLRYNAYSEGWALYAEQLADEQGWYEGDVFARLGYLQSQLRRACRLVVDTGLHARAWSREQALEWMVRTTGSERSAMAGEIDRYCVKPGQACGYMIGASEILRVRERIRRSLGPRFDLRAFNDAVVTAGNTPLSQLERAVSLALRPGS